LLHPTEGSDINDIIERIFETILQQKLNLLHDCLTPTGALKAMNSLSSEYLKIEQEVIEVLFKDPNSDEIDTKKTSIEYLAEDERRDCFSEEYIYQLTHLRNSLLNQ